MNAIVQNAYLTAGRVSKTPRETEAELFARVSARLQLAVDCGDFRQIVGAVQDNMGLWNALADDLSDPGNRLPAALRAQLIYLAQFTRIQTNRILDGSGEVAPLIEVNNAVMRGLNGKAA